MQAASIGEASKESAPRTTMASNGYVINLCSSTSPVSLVVPDHAGLRRFSFFISRRIEDGRERFRLHMGYFDTLEEAQKLIDVVREIYPSAWAGERPGQRLQPRAAPRQVPVITLPRDTAAEAAAPTSAPSAAHEAVPAPVAVAAPTGAPAAVPATSVSEASAPTPDVGQLPVPEKAVAPEPAGLEAPTGVSSTAPAEAVREATVSAGADAPAPAVALELEKTANHSLQSVREAIASLGDEKARELNGRETMQLLGEATGDTVLAPPPRQAFEPVVVPRPETSPAPTGVGARPLFAVQLIWSVQPIDIAAVPQLAIFDAYTLYAAEGNRDGRRWYGLRLGFFTDAMAAKQVAHYVRSEFSTVSVVPVTVRESERAKLAQQRPAVDPHAAGAPTTGKAAERGAATRAAPAATPAPAGSAGGESDFKFLDEPPVTAEQAGEALRAGSKPAAGAAAVGARAKRPKLRTQGQALGRGRAKTKALSLDQTLEILGAGELEMGEGDMSVNWRGGSQRPRREEAKADTASTGTRKLSRLARLFEKIAETINGD